MSDSIIKVKKSGFYQDKIKLNLAGSHTWNTVQSIAGKKVSLDALTGNFTRLWTIETKGFVLGNKFYGSNLSGLAKVDVVPWKKDGRLNKQFYAQFEKVVKRAEKRDIVVGVCLFDNAWTSYMDRGWEFHPFNGLGPSDPSEVHSKGPWNTFQRAHVKEMVKILEPYNNVIFEVGNELHRNSVSSFQKNVVKWVKKFTDKPVGVSYASRMKPSAGRTQSWIAKTNADWAAPAGGERIPGFKGHYVFDTDHASALRTNVAGLQAANRRGDSLWLMDGLGGDILRNASNLAPDRAYINSIL